MDHGGCRCRTGIGASVDDLEVALRMLDLVFLCRFSSSTVLSSLRIVFYVNEVNLSWRSETTKKRCL
jgi:hypothetical protein